MSQQEWAVGLQESPPPNLPSYGPNLSNCESQFVSLGLQTWARGPRMATSEITMTHEINRHNCRLSQHCLQCKEHALFPPTAVQPMLQPILCTLENLSAVPSLLRRRPFAKDPWFKKPSDSMESLVEVSNLLLATLSTQLVRSKWATKAQKIQKALELVSPEQVSQQKATRPRLDDSRLYHSLYNGPQSK